MVWALELVLTPAVEKGEHWHWAEGMFATAVPRCVSLPCWCSQPVSKCPLAGSSNAPCPCCSGRKQAQISIWKPCLGARITPEELQDHAECSWRAMRHCESWGDVCSAAEAGSAWLQDYTVTEKSEFNLVFFQDYGWLGLWRERATFCLQVLFQVEVEY